MSLCCPAHGIEEAVEALSCRFQVSQLTCWKAVEQVIVTKNGKMLYMVGGPQGLVICLMLPYIIICVGSLIREYSSKMPVSDTGCN